jgi:hypothetical protein
MLLMPSAVILIFFHYLVFLEASHDNWYEANAEIISCDLWEPSNWWMCRNLQMFSASD